MPLSPPDTRASLILRLQNAADVVAWDEFAEIYSPLVFRLARRHGLQAADADDLVQEVLAAVARSVSRWLDREDRGSFRAWLFRIARNYTLDFLTRRKHRPWAAGGDDAARLYEELSEAKDLSSDFDIEYRREVFHWASDHVREVVSETTWLAFWLTAVENNPIDKIADRLGVSVGSVYIARSRVMKRLRSLVREYGEIVADDDV